MGSLTHVCVWSSKGWTHIAPEEVARSHPGESVSARSGLFMCELCGQYAKSYIHLLILRCKMLVGGVPQAPLVCIFQCRLRIPAGRFLPGDVLRVVQNLHEVRSGFCQRSILHLFRDRRIQKRNAPFLHTEKANLNKLRGMQHRKVAHRAYRR